MRRQRRLGGLTINCLGRERDGCSWASRNRRRARSSPAPARTTLTLPTPLYAYVGNDPVDGRDPTGECHTTTTPDGGTALTGICGGTRDEQDFVNGRLADPASDFSKGEKEASPRVIWCSWSSL